MLKRIIRNNLRRPLYSAAVLLFAAVLTVVLCYLHQSGQEELRSFEETYASVPVTFRVTDLDASKPKTVAGWIVDLFGEQGMQPNLAPFVGEFYTRVSCSATYVYPTVDASGFPVDGTERVNVAGIGSLYVAEELTQDWGGEVHWLEGYDESILLTEELVCLLPQELPEDTPEDLKTFMKDRQEIELTFVYTIPDDYEPKLVEEQRTLKVVGYYTDKGNTRIYCPYAVMERVCAELGASKEMEEVCAVLNDNNSLAQLKEAAAQWFAEPNPMGKETEWDRFGYQYYPYALDIEDTMLTNLESDLKSSMQINQLASAVVFALSAGAGFLTGFLVIRSRKREIALLRTMGTPHTAIFVQFALEQMLCILTGILLGGAFFLWQPVQKLALFGGIYFVGLSIALVIFLCKNLLTTIKEDE